jgi:hypothetical protein
LCKTDVAEKYIEAAIEAGFSVIDVNIPKYTTEETVCQTTSYADYFKSNMRRMTEAGLTLTGKNNVWLITMSWLHIYGTITSWSMTQVICSSWELVLLMPICSG